LKVNKVSKDIEERLAGGIDSLTDFPLDLTDFTAV